MSATIGIDFGTASCSVAAVQNGAARMLTGRDGPITRSTIVLTRDDLLVGVDATNHAGRSVHNIKRLLGRRFRSTDMRRAVLESVIQTQVLFWAWVMISAILISR